MKHVFSQKKFIIIISILLLGAGTYFLFNTNQSHHTITLTDSGFIPNELNIHLGDTVTFISELEGEFWPASNVHPTHIAYSEFDPKKPIPEGETWSFTFDTAGVWGFHDHLDALNKGVIRVNKKDSTLENSTECDVNKVQCYEQALREKAVSEGVEEAFIQLQEWYESDQQFRTDCHSYVHILGEEAYNIYKSKQHVVATPLAELCGFGFYHGFMENMLHTTGDLSEARNFCAFFDALLSRESPSARSACYHGIGHGVVDGSNPTQWGSAEDMIKEGLDLCTKIGESYYEKKRCGTGVFNSLANLYFEPKFGLVINKEDPYGICRKQKESFFQEACYENMNTLVAGISNNDFEDSLQHVRHIKDEEFAPTAMRSVATVFGIISDPIEYEMDALLCQNSPSRLRSWCFDGFAVGIIEAGSSEKDYSKVFEFCDSASISEKNKKMCYSNFSLYAKRAFSESVHRVICKEVNKRYPGLCGIDM